MGLVVNKMHLPVNYDKLSPKQRREVRGEYVKIQGGRCYHCQGRLDVDPPSRVTQDPIEWWRFPGGREGFLRHPVHLHHNHDTGMTIGATHSFCNAWLFQYYGE